MTFYSIAETKSWENMGSVACRPWYKFFYIFILQSELGNQIPFLFCLICFSIYCEVDIYCFLYSFKVYGFKFYFYFIIYPFFLEQLKWMLTLISVNQKHVPSLYLYLFGQFFYQYSQYFVWLWYPDIWTFISIFTFYFQVMV